MVKKNEEFLKRLLDTFRIEAQEHIKALSSGLVELEKSPAARNQQGLIENVFREAHSLKGAARAVNMSNIETLCQSLENVFAMLKSQKLAVSASLFDLLHEAVDLLGKLSVGGATVASQERTALAVVIERLSKAASGQPIVVRESATDVQAQPESIRTPLTPEAETSSSDTETVSASVTETMRIPVAKLNPILLQAEELFLAKLASGQRISELREFGSSLDTWEREWRKMYPELQQLRHSLEKNGRQSNDDGLQLRRLVEFLDWNQTHVKQLENRLVAAMRSAERDNHSVGLIVDDLLENAKKVMIVSFSTILEAFPRMVRDISNDRGKEVGLVIKGGEVEIDRRILEEVKDPLIHLVRNCIEHGIEIPSERQMRNKPPKGAVTLAIAQRGSQIELTISDDGAGIDVARIKTAAIRLGTISEDEAQKMTDSEAMALIFLSGITTSLIITDISGRGLDLAIAREKVVKVGGAISFETRPGSGTTFRLILPVTTTAFRGVTVRVAEHLFVVPSANIERVVKVKNEEIKTVENRQTIEFSGQVVSLVYLGDALGLVRKNMSHDSESSLPAIILKVDEKHIAFVVDDVIDEGEVLVKSLGKQLSHVPNVTGATVFSTGRLVPVISVQDLMKSAIEVSISVAEPAKAPLEEGQRQKQSILIVEDSITARTLLKNILEAAGYGVTTAVDGIDAFTQLRSGQFDVVVSDVDMPRMNGFDLTARIRADKKLAELPVVLLTALESREHRERGVEVGASAYIVKSSFDQSNLLEVIRRLI